MTSIPQLRKALAAKGYRVHMQVSNFFNPTRYWVYDKNQSNWPAVLFSADKDEFRAWAIEKLQAEV